MRCSVRGRFYPRGPRAGKKRWLQGTVESPTPWAHLPIWCRACAGTCAQARLPLPTVLHLTLLEPGLFLHLPFFGAALTSALQAQHQMQFHHPHVRWEGSQLWCSLTGLLPLLPAPLPNSPGHSLLGEGPLERPGARLCLPDGPLKTAAKRRYGKRRGLEDTAHVLIAGEHGPSHLGH